MSIQRRRDFRKRTGRGVKSDHKHDYQDVLLREHTSIPTVNGVVNSLHYHTGRRCRLCGKLSLYSLFSTTVKTEEGYYRSLSSEEILDRYKDLPIVDIDSIFQRYA